MQITVKVNAKLNLSLDVTGVRADGYHLLEMVMQSVSIADTVNIATNDSGKITAFADLRNLPENEDNLAGKAAKLFYESLNEPCKGIEIYIKKRIPVAAGLGGGSADAAGVLLGLNHLMKEPFDQDELEGIAVKVGADVPFCLQGGTMTAGGIGGILSPLPTIPDCYFVIAKPLGKESTADMFGKLDKIDVKRHPDTDKIAESICGGDLAEIGSLLYNVFEEVWTEPVMREAKSALINSGAIGATISGSGPAIFGIFSEKSAAQSAVDQLKKRCDTVLLCTPAKTGFEIDRVHPI